MLSTAYLLIVIFGCTVQNVLRMKYNEKTANRGVYTFCWISALVAMVVFAFTIKQPATFDVALIPHSVGFAVSYIVASVFLVLALQEGSLAITSLIISYSLIIPTFYGLIFLKDEPSVCFWIGLVLLFVSIFLINYKSEGEAHSRFTLKWLLYVVPAFVGNGMCSVTQSVQVNAFKNSPNPMSSEFMVIALIITTVVMLLFSLFGEKKDFGALIKHGWHFAVLCGLFNGIVNLLVILLQRLGELPVSVIFPCISGGGMIVTYIVSLTLFKEKMTKAQTVGFFVGVFSVVFLNL